MARRTARKATRKTARKTTRKATRMIAKPKAKKKATKRKTTARKTTTKRRATAARRGPAKPKARQAIPIAMPGGQIGRMSQEVAREMKKMVNKYLSMVMKHAKYYENTKYWTKKSMYRLMRMGKELEATQRQYLKMAQQYLRNMMQ